MSSYHCSVKRYLSLQENIDKTTFHKIISSKQKSHLVHRNTARIVKLFFIEQSHVLIHDDHKLFSSCVNGWRKNSSDRLGCFGPRTNMLKNKNSYFIHISNDRLYGVTFVVDCYNYLILCWLTICYSLFFSPLFIRT